MFLAFVLALGIAARPVIEAARTHAPADAEIVLLHVTDSGMPDVAHGYAARLGRGHRERDPGTRIQPLGSASRTDVLRSAAERLGRACVRRERVGRPDREVIAAVEPAELLILARDGDHARLGPKSLGRAGRFTVDHAPCPVLLVWPVPAPGIDTIPPHPPHRP